MADSSDLSSLSDDQLKQLHLQSLSDDDLQKLYQPPQDLRSDQAGMSRGFMQGLRTVPDEGAAMLTKGLEAVAPAGSDFEKYMHGEAQRVGDINQKAEADYQATNPGPSANIGRIAGSALATAPIAYAMPGATAEGLIPRIASGMASGAISGPLQTPTNPSQDFGTQKLEQSLLGGAAGAIAPVATGAAARMISPNVSPDVKSLMAQGITPTPGQIMGGVGNRLEEAGQSIPFVGDAIKAARMRAVGDFNTGAINKALAPIGESLDPNTTLGRDAVSEMHDKITNQYNSLLPTLKVQADPQFVNDMQTLVTNAKSMPPERAKQFQDIISTTLGNRFSPGGGMTGQSYQEADSALKSLASDYSHSSVADERQLGGALKQTQSIMNDLLMRSNPNEAPQLAAINNAYAQHLRVQGAAGRIGSDQGVFTPAQFLSATRELDPSLRKGSFSRGDALMQDYGDAGKAVLGNKVPDSGTPLRSALMAAPALTALYEYNPLAAAGVAGAGALGTAAYSRPAQSALATLLARRPNFAAPLASGVRAMSPATSALGAAIAAQRANPQAQPVGQ